jgi:tetratricopeptide (TPR) repeat protein
MDPYLVLVFVLLLFVLLFAGMSLLRREPPSWRWAAEVLVSGAVILLAARAAQAPPSPLLFVVALYLLAMRVRILIDAGNLLASRGRLAAASRLYALALWLATSPTDRSAVWANQGAALLLAGQVPAATAILEKVLSSPLELGIKLEAACRCNLGLAYLREGRVGQGRAQLHEAADLLPGSVFSRRARFALQQLEGPPAGSLPDG